ncbi:aldo/keto reductase [Phenylobacterium soli]|uniref:Oxidoreductase n=1 Tax=Phenylobacterium soli TaxID=2170551 RepID=A0A328AK17_9CAUL|nr:aldo/keto reductase [Phenylobacterium soli]RAK54745.1 oxidoreductase [Phenylobacterium soli]
MAQPHAAAGGHFTIGGDLTVNRLGFGAYWMCGDEGWGEAPRGAVELLRRLPDLGVNLIDTADSYGPHVSELTIREALRPYPKDLVIATKGGYARPRPNAWIPLGRPEYLIASAKQSASRLGVETIDLWQLHRIDPKTPIHDQFDAIARLRAEGVIRHVGLSEVGIEEIEAAQAYFPVATVQNLYNLANRHSEAVLDWCEAHGVGFMPWYPLGQGSVMTNETLHRIAPNYGATPAQLALAWLLRRSPVMLPIPGTRDPAHLTDNVAAAAIRLSDEDFEALSAIAPPRR